MTIQFDAVGFGDGSRKIRWNEIVAVGVRTTPDGPWREDVFWQFLTPGGVVELPGQVVDPAALGEMQTQLPGIDDRKIVSAMGSRSERIWRIWHVEESKLQWKEEQFAARFATLVERLGGAASRANEAFSRLRAAWSAGKRHYHGLEHLADCLRELDEFRAEPRVAEVCDVTDMAAAAAGMAGMADVAELALWYHDAVYEPGARDNEERSATLLREDGMSLAVPMDRLLAAAACVRATKHLAGAAPSEPAADLVVDVDLAILGRDVLRFMEFEYSVAEEYAGISPTSYFLARGRFLAALLASRSIFRTARFRERYEARARANIAALLQSRRYRAHRWLGRVYRWL